MTTDTSEKTIQQLIDADEIPEINGCPVWAVIEFIDNIGVKYFDDLTDVEDQLEDAYQGIYKSEKEFGEEYADDVVIAGSESAYDDAIVRYFDYEMFTRDLFMGDFYSLEDPSRNDPDFTKRNYDIAVFRNL